MKAIRSWGPAAAVALFGMLASAQALTNPPIRIADGIEYMCGGHSQAEAAFMETVAPRWAATLQFGVNRAKPGEVPGEVQVQVRERYSGRVVLEANTAEPYMLARLEPGTYQVDATLAGLTLEQPLIVFAGLGTKAAFVWPSNVDYAAAARPAVAERQALAHIGD